MIPVDAESVVDPMIGSWNDETYDGGRLAVKVNGASLSSDSGCDLGFCCPSACLCSIRIMVLLLSERLYSSQHEAPIHPNQNRQIHEERFPRPSFS